MQSLLFVVTRQLLDVSDLSVHASAPGRSDGSPAGLPRHPLTRSGAAPTPTGSGPRSARRPRPPGTR